MDRKKRITVFGGSTPIPGEPAYKEAYDLGRLIGKAGYAVLTGGYIGTMEAVSRGANEAGGHVIGVTCDEIEAFRPSPPNRWIHQEMRYSTLRERMYALMDHCDLAIALPGGIGTLAEIAAMWSGLQTGDFKQPPMILVGEGWARLFGVMRVDLASYVREPHWKLIDFAADVNTAFNKAHESLNGVG